MALVPPTKRQAMWVILIALLIVSLEFAGSIYAAGRRDGGGWVAGIHSKDFRNIVGWVLSALAPLGVLIYTMQKTAKH
ncbi:MAG TPA: hypothetical protein VJ600_06905 [Holophagaceae bacterium]|nr:hypothetical protein [Holophagaceae bacterium]